MNVWIAIGVTAVGCYLVKLARPARCPPVSWSGPSSSGWPPCCPSPCWPRSPPSRPSATAPHLVLDARAAGLAAAAVALVLRAPFLLVVGVAVVVTAGVRALGG